MELQDRDETSRVSRPGRDTKLYILLYTYIFTFTIVAMIFYFILDTNQFSRCRQSRLTVSYVRLKISV